MSHPCKPMAKISICILIFFITLASYFTINIGQSSDNHCYIPTTLSLLQEGNLNLDEFSPICNPKFSRFYSAIKTNKQTLLYFPYGTSTINYPLTLFTQHLYNDLDDEKQLLQLAQTNANIFAAFSVALLWLFLFNLTKSIPLSVFLSFVFAFASPHLSNHGSGGLWSHNISSFLLILGLLISQSKKRSYFMAIPFRLSLHSTPHKYLRPLKN